MSKPTRHGGARKGAGRHPSPNPTNHTVSFRLTTAEFLERTKAAKKAGYETVHAYAKALLLGAE